MWFLLACHAATVPSDSSGDLASEGEADADTDTDADTDADADADTDTDRVTAFALYSADRSGAPAQAWASWFALRGTVALYDVDDPTAPSPAEATVVVLLPDLPEAAAGFAGKVTGHGGNVLALGVGGAWTYDGLGLGIGRSAASEVHGDTMRVDDGAAPAEPFTAVDLPEDLHLQVHEAPVPAVALVPPKGFVPLAWDPDGAGAVVGHAGRYWSWGWGTADAGGPDTLTEDGAAVLASLAALLRAGDRAPE